MEKLIRRVESATGPSRELDVAIWCAVNGHEVDWSENRMLADGVPIGSIDPGKHQRNFTLWSDADRDTPHFTASLDAALTLVPAGWPLQLFQKEDCTWFCRLKRVSPYALVAPFEDGERGLWSVPTAPIAVLIAALRARAGERDDV